jgi:hypothetical protein
MSVVHPIPAMRSTWSTSVRCAVSICLVISCSYVASSYFELINDHKYYLSETRMNWFEAESYCESLNGQLATFASVHDYDAATNHFRKQGFVGSFWVGYHNLNNFSRVDGVDGASGPYVQWVAVQLNRVVPTANCVAVYRDNHAHGSGCEQRLAVLCKYSAESRKVPQSECTAVYPCEYYELLTSLPHL